MNKRSIEAIRKEEIINAFFKVVSEKGLAGASIRKIADTLGCNHGILRYYFGSKEELIMSAIDIMEKKYITQFQEGISKYDSSIDQLKYLLSYGFDKLGIQLSDAWVEIFVFSKTNPNISKTLHEFYKKVINNIENIIRIGIESGEFRDIDPSVTANTILGYLEGTFFLSVVNTDDTYFESVGKQFREMFLEYLLKKNE
ncbi:MAG: TetR/AcrR family transcriptional regulator [Clostridia bacterium]|nr:TetR/AcrR family transcriptional regulator [Clostridia bacterium]